MRKKTRGSAERKSVAQSFRIVRDGGGVLFEDEAMASPTRPDGGDYATGSGSGAGSDLFSGIKAEIAKLLEQFQAGKLDAATVGQKVIDYLQAHTDLTADDQADDLEDDDEDRRPNDK